MAFCGARATRTRRHPAPVVPSGLPQDDLARPRIAGRIAALDYVGLRGRDVLPWRRRARPERLMVNRSRRAYNSGHWTIKACAVSQFENHMRAVAVAMGTWRGIRTPR
jgi:5-(carboxyamino)imidazole ribonucleotide synthase